MTNRIFGGRPPLFPLRRQTTLSGTAPPWCGNRLKRFGFELDRVLLNLKTEKLKSKSQQQGIDEFDFEIDVRWL